MSEPRKQEQLESNLRLLSTFHYVVGGLAALLSFLPSIHLVIGIAMLTGAITENGQAPPAFLGWIFVGLALAFIAAGLTVAVLILMAGRRISQRRSYQFCMVVGGIECIFVPFGTILGVFTLVILNQDEVRAMFEG